MGKSDKKKGNLDDIEFGNPLNDNLSSAHDTVSDGIAPLEADDGDDQDNEHSSEQPQSDSRSRAASVGQPVSDTPSSVGHTGTRTTKLVKSLVGPSVKVVGNKSGLSRLIPSKPGPMIRGIAPESMFLVDDSDITISQDKNKIRAQIHQEFEADFQLLQTVVDARNQDSHWCARLMRADQNL